MRGGFRFIFFCLFLFSFLLLLAVTQGGFGLGAWRADFSSFIPSGLLMDDIWYGVYFQDNFVGYWHSLLRLQNENEGGGYLLQSSGSLNLPVLGMLTALNINSRIVLEPNYLLRAADFSITSQDYVLSGTLKRDEDAYALEVNSGSGKIQKIIPFSGGAVNSFLGPPAFNYVPLKRRVDFSFYDPLRGRAGRMLLENTGKRNIDINGKTRSLYAIRVEGDGLEGMIFVDDKGKMVKQDFLGFTFVEEDFAALNKKKSFGPVPDIVDKFSIRCGNLPGNLRYLKLEVSGIPAEYPIDDFNQKVTAAGEKFIVEVNQDNYFYEPGGNSDVYLKEDDFIKFKDARLVSLAESIAADARDDFAVLRKLSRWIDKNIAKVPTFSLPNTLDVLRLRRGDCGELSVLLAGMLRARGIPAYVNVGLVYNQGRFFYHAWVSAYINGRWLDTDPALGQVKADAARIKFFKSLDAQFELARIIGKIKLKAVDYD